MSPDSKRLAACSLLGGEFHNRSLGQRRAAEAEDLMQDAYLKVWEHWHRVRSLDDSTGYLYRTAMNLYRKRRRRAAVAIRHAIRPRPPRDQLEEVESRDEVSRPSRRSAPGNG